MRCTSSMPVSSWIEQINFIRINPQLRPICLLVMPLFQDLKTELEDKLHPVELLSGAVMMASGCPKAARREPRGGWPYGERCDMACR